LIFKGKSLKFQSLTENHFTLLLVFVHQQILRCTILTIDIRVCFDIFSK